MATISSDRIYTFDDHFCSIFKASIVQRKSKISPFALQHIKLLLLAAVLVLIQKLDFYITLVKLLRTPDLDMVEVNSCAAFASIYLICFCRAICFLINRKRLRHLLLNLEALFPTTHQDQVSYNLQKFAEATIKRNKVLKILCTCGCFGYLTLPLLESLYLWKIKGRKFPYKYAFDCWYPFDENQLLAYPMIYILHVTSCLGAGIFFFYEEMLFTSSVTQIRMYYEYLGKQLSELDASKEPENYLKLRNLIRYQYVLDSLQDDVNQVFSQSTFICFTTVKMTLCLFAISLLHVTDVISMLPLISSLLALIVTIFLRCSIGTDLYTASAALIDSIYDHNWYEGTPAYRKMIVIMMIKANMPAHLQASKFKFIGLEYFKEIAVESYQILTFLYNVMQ